MSSRSEPSPAFRVLAPAVIAALAACGGDDGGGGEVMGPSPSVETVEVAPESMTLTTLGASEQFEATALDAEGDTVPDVEVAWDSNNDAVATVDGTGTATARGIGEASITATVEGVTGSATLTVNQAVDRLAFRTGPSDATAGESLDPAVQVEVLDAQGNVVEDAEMAVTVEFGQNPGGGTLKGTMTVNAVGGVATFGNLVVETAASGYTLTAMIPGDVSPVESGTFAVSAAEAARLGFAAQPSDATAGQAISPAVEVVVRDEFGNPVMDVSPDVSVSLAANPGGGTLAGTTTATASDGVASFGDLSLETAASGYRLGASAPDFQGATSSGFTVQPASPARLAFRTAPTEPFALRAISPAVEVAVQDEFGNPVPEDGRSIGVVLSENPKGAELSGTLTRETENGVATFDDLAIDRLGRGYELLASTTGLSEVETGPFRVTARFDSVTAGGRHSCGVTTDDQAYCWGDNFAGALGDGTFTSRTTPVLVAGDLSFSAIDAGFDHTCGIDVNQLAYCWGRNGFGQIGNGTTGGFESSPQFVTDPMDVVSASGEHACGVGRAPDGSVSAALCWGNNENGQVGDGTTTDRSSPTEVSGDRAFRDVDVDGHSCGLLTTGEPFCWGPNGSGQLGDGTTTQRTTPTAVSGGLDFAMISAGGGYTCGVTPGGDAYCWGNNDFGQLGDGTTTQRTTPTAVSGGLDFAAIDAGGGHTCGVTTGGDAYCWGRNGSGQLGDGTTTQRTAPTLVSGGLEFAAVSAGSSHTCGVTTGGDAYCWGSNDDGRLGDGTTVGRLTPTRVVH